MSTKSNDQPLTERVERRRKPAAVRQQALDVAKELLIAGGPRAITLKAIGERLGMTHANLIHHFGSAEAFQACLRDTMVEDITRKATSLVSHGDGKRPDPPSAIVDQVFDAYASGGLGMLMAWSTLTGDGKQDEGIERTTAELVAVVEATIERRDAPTISKRIVSLVTLLAFADSLIGPALSRTIGSDPAEVRKLTARLVETLAV